MDEFSSKLKSDNWEDDLSHEWVLKGDSIPHAGKERVHLNFWLFNEEIYNDSTLS